MIWVILLALVSTQVSNQGHKNFLFYVCCIYISAFQTRFHYESKNYEPLSDGSFGSSLIWVHTVCNVSYLSKILRPETM